MGAGVDHVFWQHSMYISLELIVDLDVLRLATYGTQHPTPPHCPRILLVCAFTAALLAVLPIWQKNIQFE